MGHRRGRTVIELRARIERDSRERTDGEKTALQDIWEVRYKAGVLEPGSEYRVAQPGSHALQFHRKAPGGPPEQSHS